jgi:hypothetical protein
MGFLDEPAKLAMLKKMFYASLVALVVLEFVLMGIHVELSLATIAEFPAFHAIYGFVGCFLMVFVVKFLGHHWLMKEEDYYD